MGMVGWRLDTSGAEVEWDDEDGEDEEVLEETMSLPVTEVDPSTQRASASSLLRVA